MNDGLDDRCLGKLFKVFIEVDFKLLFFFHIIEKWLVVCGLLLGIQDTSH